MENKNGKAEDKVSLPAGQLTPDQGIDDDLREIDHVHDELFPSYLVPADDEIDNLYDELFPAEAGGEAEQVAAPAVLEGIDGSTYYVFGAQPGHPGNDEITFLTEDDTESQTVPLAGFSCVRTATKPAGFIGGEAPCGIETIETSDGQRYDLFVPREQQMASGIFAFSTRKDILGHTTVDQYYFFPFCNIRQRSRKSYLGEILIEKGLIEGAELARALDEQQQRRSCKIGEIIAEKANIPQHVVEEEIRQAYQENKPGRVGEILVAGGLVDEKLVQAALLAQKQLKKKIGELLMEKGRLSDEQVFGALAEKFRMTFLDLRRESFSKKVLATIPREVAVQFQLLPITFRGGFLVVATMVPDDPAVRNILRKHAGQHAIQLVLARPSQLRKAISQLYR
jgi:hypothetical protein